MSTAPTSTESTLAVGSCRGCGYALQGLESRRCPECGRAFDPGNPKTMNMGRKPGWLATKLMRPIGWPTVLLMFLGTAAIAVTTRPQEGNPLEWDWSFVDVGVYADGDTWNLGTSSLVLTFTDYTYGVGLVLAFASMLYAVLRVIAGGHCALWNDWPLGPALPRRRTLMAIPLCAVVAILCVSAGWPYRLGQNWAATRRAIAPNPVGSGSISLKSDAQQSMPLTQDPADQRAKTMIEAALAHGSPEVRRAALALYVETQPSAAAVNVLRRTLKEETDVQMQVTAARVLGIRRDPTNIDVLIPLLSAADPEVRTAAADAIAMIREDGGSLDMPSRYVAGDPPVELTFTMLVSDDVVVSCDGVLRSKTIRSALSHQVVQRLSEMMVGGATVDEREAAARALLADSPANQNWRFAEFAVIRQVADRSARPQSPPAHRRFGESVRSIADRTGSDVGEVVAYVMMTAGRPTVVAMQTQVTLGHISGAFPTADGYSADWRVLPPLWSDAALSARIKAGETLRPQGLKPYSEARGRYAWLDLDPSPLPGDWLMLQDSGRSTHIRSLGFRWHHLIVLPEKAAWMQPPAVPADPKYAWWTRLREVPSSWVSSRGESERFLYYDGPTLLPSPVAVREAEGGVLMLQARGADDRSDEDQPDYAGVSSIDALSQTARKGRRTERRGMYITVADGVVSAEVVPVPKAGEKADPPVHIIGSGTIVRGDLPAGEGESAAAAEARGLSPRRGGVSAAETLLREWVIDAGLTPAEADGMMFAWRKQFFETDGRRFVLLMSAVDYDSLCPISITPPPTEMARVGLVWTEMAR